MRGRWSVALLWLFMYLWLWSALAGAFVEAERPSRDLSQLSEEASSNTAALDEELFVRPKWRYKYIRSPFAGPYAVYAVEVSVTA